MEIISSLSFFVLALIAYKREDTIEKYLSNYRIMKHIVPFIICFAISFLFAITLALSPFNNLSPGTDSSVFLYIGREMLHGSVPYRDLFDHKGIVLYFIEYLGYLIGFGNKIGVWIIELLNIFFTSLIFYRISCLFTKSKVICYLSVFIVWDIVSSPFFFSEEGGNLTEEYALPWIALSLYFVIKFFVTENYKNWHIIAIGFSFATVFFLRVNMVGLWAALLLAVVIYFIKNKRSPEIIKCAVLFIIGCITLFVPVMVYLLLTNSLEYMIRYYFIFNIHYTSSGGGIKNIIPFILSFISLSGIVPNFFIVYSLTANFKSKISWINIFTFLLALLSASVSGQSFMHYYIILVPFFLIPTVLSLLPFMEKTKDTSTCIKKTSVLVSAVILSVFGIFANFLYNSYSALKSPVEESNISQYLHTNTKETDDVLFTGNVAAYYIDYNRRTNNKYFYQLPPVDMDNSIYEEFIAEFEENLSDYIVIDKADYEYYTTKFPIYKTFVSYLDRKCEEGIYRLEEYADFNVYVKK